MATHEDACRCPRCGMPGNVVNKLAVPGKRGVMVETVRCENERCIWFQTPWIVQVNPDGTIPERQAGPKQFELPKWAAEAGRRQVEQLEAEFEQGEVKK